MMKSLFMNKMHGVLLLMVLASSLGCRGRQPLTEIVVAIDSEVPLRSLQVQTQRATAMAAPTQIADLLVSSPPWTLSLTRPAGPYTSVRIRVVAETSEGELIVQTAQTDFVANERLVLPFLLTASCVGVTEANHRGGDQGVCGPNESATCCGQGLTCRAGDCTALRVNPDSLERYTDGTLTRFADAALVDRAMDSLGDPSVDRVVSDVGSDVTNDTTGDVASDVVSDAPSDGSTDGADATTDTSNDG